jgi:hypothetical protein
MSSMNAMIEELLAQWEEGRARGEDTSAEELCRDHSELLETVSRVIAERREGVTGGAARPERRVPHAWGIRAAGGRQMKNGLSGLLLSR